MAGAFDGHQNHSVFLSILIVVGCGSSYSASTGVGVFSRPLIALCRLQILRGLSNTKQMSAHERSSTSNP